MRYTKIGLLVSALVGMLAASVSPASAAAGGMGYIGPKVQAIVINESEYRGQAINVGVMGGFQLLGKDGKIDANLGGGTLAVEGDISITVVPGAYEHDYVCGVFVVCTADGDWTITTAGVFAAYRYPMGKMYAKGKAGVSYHEVEIDVDDNGIRFDDKDRTVGVTLGGGIGMNLGPGVFEAELLLSPRSEQTISVGVAYLLKF